MPKKRLSKTLQTKPSSSAPATLAASTIAISKHGETAATSKPAPSSVNELIKHLRQTQVSDEHSHRFPRTPSAATVHPSLRGILNVPDTSPPRPRQSINTVRPSGPTRGRGIPGPPPPASWLVASSHADTSQDHACLTNIRVEQSSSLPGGSFPAEGSLRHTVLKAVATNLHWLLEYDSVYLLPTQLKQNLLSYIAVYQEEPECSRHEVINAFRLLFPRLSADHVPGDSSVDDSSDVSYLDFGGAIGRWLSTKEFKELFYIPKAKVIGEESDILPNSWDDEYDFSCETGELTAKPDVEADTMAEGTIEGGARASKNAVIEVLKEEAASGLTSGWPKGLDGQSLRFSNLAHLSLALSPTVTPYHKRSAASWPDLLKLVPSLSRLSSLSLAHWPAPTLTPNAASTYATIKNPVSASLPGIPYSGSDMYTSFDGDWTEAANLLKILSRNLYCLQWLDLTGCGDWFAALSAVNGPEWSGSWRGMQRVRLCVGWQPEPLADGNVSGYHYNRVSTVSSSQVADTSEVRRFNSVPPSRGLGRLVLEEDEEAGDRRRKYYHQKAVEKYSEIRRISHNVAKSINSRRKGLGKWIEFDLSPESLSARDD